MTYDLAGRQTSLAYPDGLTVAYQYDASNNLIGLDSPAGWARYTVDPDGRLLDEQLSGGALEYRYDAADQLIALRRGDDGEILLGNLRPGGQPHRDHPRSGGDPADLRCGRPADHGPDR